jgi:LmbE family N-acetylglucosaminyl deacetylase
MKANKDALVPHVPTDTKVKKTIKTGQRPGIRIRAKQRSAAIGKRLDGSRKFGRFYAVVGLTVLLGTTVVWSYLSSRLQQTNADQLSDPYLFSDPATFHGAAFPAQHTFVLKWPIFYLIKLAGYSQLSFTIATVAVATLTVLFFAALLYRLERRPLMFGTLCLALASCLALVPAQPYAGAWLPVNMAMITTRNLEYIVYIFGLVYVARRPKFNSWRFWVAVLAIALVSASDRLFLDISVGGALLSTVVYGLRQRWPSVQLSVNWLLISLMAGALALATLWTMDGLRTTHIIGQSSASPYASVHSAKGLALAGGYTVSDLLTNFGANPAYDGTVVSRIPQIAYHRLTSWSGLSYLVNALILAYGLVICLRFMLAGLIKNKLRSIKPSTSFRLTNMMIWTSLAAFAVFIVSNHDYPVDSRYLTITLFTVFIAFASYGSKRRLRPDRIILIGLVCLLSIAAAVPQVIHSQHQGEQAFANIDTRNHLVARALATHRTTTVIGDYWRVLPIRQIAGATSSLTAMPLQDCINSREVLTSKTWQPNLQKRQFAYLLSLDKGLTDFPQCDLQTITQKYGRPNSTELIAGTLAQPTELLLFYDSGIAKAHTDSAVSTILPISLDQLMHTSCPVPTVMNVVAHEDDDILFINPDTLHEIQSGHCVRTVYVTAGDDGQDRGYWLTREQGAEAAYSKMLGSKEPWVQRVVRISDHEYVTVASPRGNTKISLLFIRLPDGGLQGKGFGATHAQTLESLSARAIDSIDSVDGQSSYTMQQLTAMISTLFSTYQPSTIRTQSDYHGTHFNDHADHNVVGQIATAAYTEYEHKQFGDLVTVPIKYYKGYPIREQPVNLNQAEIRDKFTIFLEYAMHDGAVCHSAEDCRRTSTYGSYLQRQYQNPN